MARRIPNAALLSSWDSPVPSVGPFGRQPAPGLLTPSTVDPDQVFAELHNLEFAAGGGHWRIEVYSVSDQGDYRWVQMAVAGTHDYMLTVRLPEGAGSETALPALAEWLAAPSAFSHVVDATGQASAH